MAKDESKKSDSTPKDKSESKKSDSTTKDKSASKSSSTTSAPPARQTSYFSSVSTDKYRSGWDNIFSDRKK